MSSAAFNPYLKPPREGAISVALCTYNGSAYLMAQLQSIAAQTRLPDELVICDDLSSDETPAIIARFAHEAPFPVSFNTNAQRLGVIRNFEHATSLCQSNFIATCDQDDLWLPDKLAKLAGHLEADPTCLLVFSDMALMTSQGQDTGQKQWRLLGFTPADVAQFNAGHAFEKLLRYNVVTGMAMMFRKSLLAIARPFNESFIHDEWLALLAAATGTVTAIPEPSVRYRQHASQKIGSLGRHPLKQWQYARQHMGKGYVAGLLARTQSLHERLLKFRPLIKDESYLALVEEKIHHLQQRLQWREHPLTAWPGTMAQLTQGNYRRFGHGWRSFAQDLFL